MIVMITASTPSLKASSRFFVIVGNCPTSLFEPHFFAVLAGSISILARLALVAVAFRSEAS
jgi:hypothetical protein